MIPVVVGAVAAVSLTLVLAAARLAVMAAVETGSPAWLVAAAAFVAASVVVGAGVGLAFVLAFVRVAAGLRGGGK